MKVDREKEKFNPVVITLVTQEEVEAFWHLLNRPLSNSYCMDYGLNVNMFDKQVHKMWEVYRDFGCPKGR